MKFRNKILVCAILFFSFFFGIGGSILISASFRSNLSREKQAAVNSYQMVLNMMRVVNSVSTQSDYTDVVNTLKQLADNGGGSWAALRLTDGSNVIYKSAPEAAFIKELASQTEEGRSVLQIFQEDNVYYLQITGALEAGNKMLYLDGLYDVTGIYDARNAQQAIYRYVFGIALGSAFLVFWLMARFLTRPLRELSEAAREITEGNLTRRAVIYSNDEVGSLAGDFNRMTEKLSEHIEKLEDTMERQESFMGSFAHELKTPMTSIIGYADLIRSQDLTREEQREAANYIFSEGKRLENLSLKLLDLLVLKHERIQTVCCAPANLVKEAVSILEPGFQKAGIRILEECQPGECRLEPSLVMSLLLNLLDNAKKAMDGPGTIRIRSVMTPEGCRIRIEDEGRGIPPEEMEKITEAFYRVDKSRSRAQGGAGLGLALCREIAAVHHGSITFENLPEKGTAVTAELRGNTI
ncbi:MAG TPA: HAMP domain-containing histidine kinase [Candidatus Eubacterium avistercoris]|uniref:histidine kinase n=1 Tax=Candidatus Eubacterium avistercoris TaxID=2838567 RepID=A0A9D2IET8_9FIRM|nr:HAMP domain-containing histidine kinase [Candidatus Eubacterium avistercoris]